MNKNPYEIKGSLVIDRIHHRSYNMTSRIDAENLYSTLTLYHEIDKKLDKVSKGVIQMQMTLTILQEDVNKLKEAIQ